MRWSPVASALGLASFVLSSSGLVFAQQDSKPSVRAQEREMQVTPAILNGVGEATASGPERQTREEEKVIVFWSLDDDVPQTSFFQIERDSVLLALVDSDLREYEDFTAEPAETYEYCVFELQASGTRVEIGCEDGGREINRPIGLSASDGFYEDRVLVQWSDQSEIESGFLLQRDAGNALEFDGNNDYVAVSGDIDLTGGFTFEFWAARGSAGTDDGIINIEALPATTEERLEIGFTSDNRFVVAFGNDELESVETFTDSDWHHWAITYNAQSLRRSIYFDGERIATDVVGEPYEQVGDLEFGRRERTGNANFQDFFDGTLDEVRFWSIGRAPEDIAADANAFLESTLEGFEAYWPMDSDAGNMVIDVLGGATGTLINSNNSAWVATGVSDLMRIVPTNYEVFADRTAVPGFMSYTYRLAAFEDTDENGTYTPGSDQLSDETDDDGWRGVVTPPAAVSATDGQFLDRVRITWADQSSSEDGYNIYRNGGLIGSAPANSETFDDLSPLTGDQDYCVAAVSGGTDSVQDCDSGRAGDLAPPDMVEATDSTYDDRVLVTWLDTTDTESGFEVFRDDVSIGTVPANVGQFRDESAPAVTDLDYCVRAFSDADPENISYSDTVCAPGPGFRMIALPPSGVEASDAEFEDQVQISWSNPSKTAFLFKVYRDNTLIDIKSAGETQAVDTGIDSDTDFEYCVSSLTVSDASQALALQDRVRHFLSSARSGKAIGSELGADLGSASELLTEVEAQIAPSVLGKSGAVADTLFESETICDDGSRSIGAPAGVMATDNAEESNVRISWTGTSAIADGYIIRRRVGNTVTVLDTISVNLSEYYDFTGVPGTAYTYSVTAFDEFDESQPDDDMGIRELIPVTNLDASDGVSELVVYLEWQDNSSAEAGYRIYRKLASQGDGSYSAVGTTGTDEPAYIDSVAAGLRGDTLVYRVVAFDNYGESQGLADSALTMVMAPSNVNASEVYTDTVVVVWTDESMVETSYRVTVRALGVPTPAIDDTLAADTTSFGHAGVAGTTYEYCVSALLAMTGGTLESAQVCDRGALFVPEGGPVTTASPDKKTESSPANGDFGAAVDISDTQVLVGWPNAHPDSGDDDDGAVVRYSVNLSTAQLTRVDTLDLADNSTDDGLGLSVGVSVGAETYAIAATPEPGDGGWVTFKGQNYTLVEYNFPNVTDDDAAFGISVGIADSLAIIGGDEIDGPASENASGGAFICNIEASGCGYSSGLDNDPNVLHVVGGAFGHAVDIAKGTTKYYAIVGAPGTDLAYIFSCTASSGCGSSGDWTLDRRMDSPFGLGVGFGESVAISSGFALVGAPSEQRVQAYRRSGSTWSEVEVFFPAVSADSFGADVDVFDNYALVGAPNETVSGVDGAGAVYAYEWDPDAEAFGQATRYDANVSGSTGTDAYFGSAVAVGAGVYVVGAPGANSVYTIPFFYTPIDPAVEELNTPGNFTASDGDPDDRIRLRWDDLSDGEDGHYIYRSDEHGELEQLAEVEPNVEFYDDFESMPGAAYEYCVTAYLGGAETNMACDIGWIPPNGAIAGRLATREGAGTADAEVCLDPSPNRSLVFDGLRGTATIPDASELDLDNGFTIEAWIRPEATDGAHYFVSKTGTYGFGINNGDLRLLLPNIKTYTKTLSPKLEEGEWHHVAVVLDGSNDAQFYVDGQPISGAVTGSTAASPNNSPISIGQRGDGERFFEGQIDEVRIWNVERSNSQIDANWNIRMTGEEEGLIGYWPLDQGQRLVAPDISPSANHAELSGGVYVSIDGAPLNVCAVSDEEGNYTLAGLRYGESTKFTVRPFRSDRDFDPDFKTITLTPESPVQNEVDFTDVTAFTVAGKVRYETMSQTGRQMYCPVPDVSIHLDKSPISVESNIKKTTKADGSYALAVDPSIGNNDEWYVMATYVDPEDASVVHSFDPEYAELDVFGPIFDLNIADTLRHTLSGNFSGGDPGSCGKNIGIADIRIYTPDGCFDDTLRVDSRNLRGAFSLDLPPLSYLVEIVNIDSIPAALDEEVERFFQELGTRPLDMTKGDVDLDFIYRAPLVVGIEGLTPPAQCSEFSQYDEENTLIREIDPVAILAESSLAPLRFTVREDYGPEQGDGQYCNVDEGTLSIFDGIADKAEEDSVMNIRDGEVLYTSEVGAANPFGGARVDGVDRSFQKPISVIARVEGRDPVLEVDWALVEGIREREATFVSATTSEIPLLVVHDPPGDASSAYMNEGTSMCTAFESVYTVGGSAGVDIDVVLGFKSSNGLGVAIETGAGLLLQTRTLAGRSDGEEDDPDKNFEVCVSSTDGWATSDDPKYMMDDVYVGAALNLIFALADDLSVDRQACRIDLDEILATDLNNADPFATTYAYSESHITGTLLPMLENLLDLAGDADLTGTVDGEDETVSLQEAIDNWNAQIEFNDDNKVAALGSIDENRSFDGGSEISFESTYDSTYVERLVQTTIFVNSDNAIGAVLTGAGYDQKFAAAFEVHAEWVNNETETEGDHTSMGYTLADDDPGDFYSVDIAEDPEFGTPVFGLKSGRSSNPWEVGTQPRDEARLTIDPPVRDAVPNGGPAVFTMTMTNASQSLETREYVLRAIPNSNPGGAVMTAQGTDVVMSTGLSFFLSGDPSFASQEVTLTVAPGPMNLDYEDLQIQMYPAGEYPIWEDGGVGNSGIIQLADTVSFDVYFISLGTPAPVIQLEPGWNQFSISREGGTLGTVLEHVNLSHGDRIVSDHGEAKYDSTDGWSGTLSQILPGYGYKLHVQRPGAIVQTGELLQGETPVELANGWNYIGYLPAEPMRIDQALESIKDNISPGDILVGESSFVQYVERKGWVGSLTQLEPGKAYGFMIKDGGSLLYPETEVASPVSTSIAPTSGASQTAAKTQATEPVFAAESEENLVETERTVLKEERFEPPSVDQEINAQNSVELENEPAGTEENRGPEWNVVSQKYGESMTLVLELERGGVPLIDSETRVAFFAGEELRGVGTVKHVGALSRDLVFAVVYGNEKGEELTMSVYDAATQTLFDQVGVVNYAVNSAVGTPLAPRLIEVTGFADLDAVEEVPTVYALEQNYPNPFNPSTTIRYDLPKTSHVRLVVYDILGRSVMHLVDGEKEAGRYEIAFDGRGLASGTYFYELKAGDFTQVHKMILTK